MVWDFRYGYEICSKHIQYLRLDNQMAETAFYAAEIKDSALDSGDKRASQSIFKYYI